MTPAAAPAALGQKAVALGKLGLVTKVLERLIPDLGVDTAAGKDVLNSLRNLGKHVPPDAFSPGIATAALRSLLAEAMKGAPAVLAARAGMPAGGVAAPGMMPHPPGAAPGAPAPMAPPPPAPPPPGA